MTLADVVRKAAEEPFTAGEVEAFCAEHVLSVSQFCDAVAHEVASGYGSGTLSFDFCDGVMNHLWAFTSMGGKYPMPPYAYDVFIAFDDGEYHHQKDPPSSSAEELHTKPRIAEILARGKSVT